MEENLFKDVQIVSVAADEEDTDLVYIDDEEEPRVSSMTAIKIELKNEDPKRASTPFETANLISNLVTDEQKSGIEEIESYKTCTIATDFLKTPVDMDDDCSIQEQEQFEIVENADEKDTSTDMSTNDSTRANKSNESNDHSYSQPPQPSKESNSLYDDIFKNILQEANLSNSKDAIILLKGYTKFFENLTNEHQNSQLSLYLKQMMFSLNNNEDLILTKPDKVPDETCDKSETEIAEKVSEELFNTMEIAATSIEMMEASPADISEKSDVIQVKQEIVMETFDTGNTVIENKDICKVNGTIGEEADKLQVYVKKAQEKTAEFCENNQKLLDSVFVSEEDIENGNSKFRTSLYNFISFNVALLMAVDNKPGEDKLLIDEEINNIKMNILKAKRTSKDTESVAGISRRSSIDGKARKSSVSSLDKDLSDSDSDNSINRLTNLASLDHRRYETQKSQNAATQKATQKAKKKTKGNSDDSSVHSESSDSETESPKKNDHKSDDENKSSDSDEELKLKHKLELKARNDLLASSEDDSGDEESYVTSQTSDFSSDDERSGNKDLKKKKKPIKKVESSDEEMSNKDEKLKESELSQKINGDAPEMNISITKSDESIKENGEDKKSRKRHRKTSFEREIFDKSLLNDSDDESSGNESNRSDGQQATKKIKKGSLNSLNRDSEDGTKPSVVDLTQPINIRADRMAPTLEKYLEKISSNTVEDLISPDQPTSSTTKIELSPKKNDQQKSSKAPSPSLDDIDCISISSESDSEISSTISEGPSRRRKQLTEEELKEETKKAKRDENERVKKLEDKEKKMTQYLSQRLSQSDVIAADELVLDYSEEKKLAIVVHETLVGKLKDHQVDGLKFMYNNCYGSLDEVKENNGSGCILAHCMGLGKTLQLIALIHTVIRYPELHTKRILIICPKSTIHNWVEEFRKWLNGLDNKPVVIYLEDNSRIEKRIDKLREWYESKRPSVFLINYESFRILANWSGSHKRSKIALPEETTKKYKQQISKYLLNPGPHIAICDEGHIIKNQKGATNRAITKITTRRRIILTGTPVQNALHEYYAMVEWIKPNILGTIHEFNNIYANPIKDGQNKDSTDHQIKKMKQKSYVLNKNLSRFVQRKDAQVLKEFLPMKYEYCISIPLTSVQERLYNTCLQANRDDHMGRNLLPIYTALRKIWTHPRVLQYAYERAKKGEHKFASIQQKEQAQKDAKKSQNVFNEDEGDEPDDIFDTSQGTTAVTNNWWNSMLTETDMNSLNSSHKMILLFEILRLCELKKEKILIFSSFVAVLDIIEGFMKAIHNQETNPNAKLYGLDKYKTTWALGKDYFRLDGSTPRNVRQEMINAFNNSPSPRLRCFLISAKAGGQGINLVAANRCIIIDTSWNPANDNQNIFRIFRLGQKKTCYVYRLVAASTMEERVYSRSVTKEAMSHRVVEKKQIDRHYVRTELEELFVPYELKPQEKTPNFPSDDILRYLLHALPKSAYNFHEHDSLLENKPDQELNEDEKNEAWNSYLAELQGNRHQLQNNNLNASTQGLGAFGKSPISADFMKLYQDMMGTSTNYGNLAGLMPSGSLSGLDTLGLSSSYFPMSSGFYTHDLLKRFGNYDPLNIYSTSLPTSTNIHSTSSTSPLMQQSVLRNSHNPISALGNMAVAATSSYNANNIPPASNSIFAPPVSSSSSNNNQSIVPTMMPYTGQSSGTQINKNLPKKKVTDLGYNKKDATKNKPLIPTNLSKRPAIMDPIVVPPNSSENLSILPDDQSPPKSIAGTSARTLPKAVNDLKKVEKISLAGKTFNAVKDVAGKIIGNQRSLIRPNVIMTKSGETNKNQLNAGFVAKTAQGTVIQKSPANSAAQRAVIPQIQNNAQLVDIRKMPSATPWLKTPTNNKTPPVNKKNLVTVSPAMKAMNRQLDKSPATTKLVNTQKQANTSGTQIINLGNTTSNDSISIIRLPPKILPPVQSVNKQSTVTPNLTTQPKVTNLRTSQPTKQVLSQNIPKILQQQQKRVIDNQTNQTLKRIRMTDSQGMTQNSQQFVSQRLNPQQMEPQRSNAQVLTQRPNVNQTGSVVRTPSQQNSQGIQNLSRVPKPSQQSNKNTTQAQPEVVEVD